HHEPEAQHDQPLKLQYHVPHPDPLAHQLDVLALNHHDELDTHPESMSHDQTHFDDSPKHQMRSPPS
ncbi:hypothetical protein AAHH80_38850, partial [Burkholderia pseudomallei]